MSDNSKTSSEQQAINEALKRDGVALLKSLGAATINHLQENPDSIISQTVMAVERDTGALTAITKGLSALLRERAAAAAAAAGKSSQTSSTKGPEIKVTNIQRK